jgi:hypothetical protein
MWWFCLPCRLFPEQIVLASANIDPKAAEQLVNLRPYKHLVLPVTKHLTIGDSDGEMSSEVQGEEVGEGINSGNPADFAASSIFEKEAFDQWLKRKNTGKTVRKEDRNDCSVEGLSEPQTEIGTEQGQELLVEPSQDDKVRKGEAAFGTKEQKQTVGTQSCAGPEGERHQNTEEDFVDDIPLPELFSPAEQYELEQPIDPPVEPDEVESSGALTPRGQAETSEACAQIPEPARAPTKPPLFALNKPFRPQFKPRKRFEALDLSKIEKSPEKDPPERHSEDVSREATTIQRASQGRPLSNPIRPSFKPLKSTGLLERLKEAIQREADPTNEAEGFDAEDTKKFAPQKEGRGEDETTGIGKRAERVPGASKDDEEEDEFDIQDPLSGEKVAKHSASGKTKKVKSIFVMQLVRCLRKPAEERIHTFEVRSSVRPFVLLSYDRRKFAHSADLKPRLKMNRPSYMQEKASKLVITIDETDVYEKKQYERRPLKKPKNFR